MGKSKKGKKDVDGEEQSDGDVEQTTVNEVSNEEDVDATKKGNKKPKKIKSKIVAKNEDSDSEEEEVVTKVEKLSAKEMKKAKKVKKAKKESDDEEEESKPVSAFALLQGDDNSDVDVSDDGNIVKSEDESEKKSKQKKKPAKKQQDAGKEKTAGGKSSRRNKKGEDDDEIDAMLAELQLEYAGVKKVESKTEIAKEPEAKKKDKKKGKKEEDPKSEVVTEQATIEDASEVKSTAAKKKDKKKKKDEPEEVPATASDVPIEAEKPTESEEVAGKKKKGPNKAMVAAMQEALKKKKEEEDRVQKEEEERFQMLEDAEEARLERVKLEAEKKEKKKQKEKERKDRLKAEGKLLTTKQKADKARAEAMLAALKASGVEVPETTAEKRSRPGTRIRPSKSKKEEQKEAEEVVVEVPVVETPVPKVEEAPVEPEKVEEVPEVVAEEIKDAWDVSDEEEEEEEEDEEETPPAKTSKKQAGNKKQVAVEDDEESGSEEDDSEDEDDDDEDDDDESGSDEDSEDSSSEEEDHRTEAEKMRERAEVRIRNREQEAEKKRTLENLRAAVVCVLGHVDTGKTKILDKLRRTNVQDGEAGGITQQIGATNVPIDAIKDNTKYLRGIQEVVFKLPGLLIIDTPGHESFSNLRSRGSSLCDIAILVVDIMHGLEPQTIESLNLLKSRKTPFVVALNKIDRLYDWQTMPRKDIRDVIKGQASNTMMEFTKRTNEIIVEFAEQGMNAALFYDNPDLNTYVSLVPTSAITGEGISNLLLLIIQFSQNQLAKRLMYSETLQATVLEVKAIPGLGTTIDVILINGKLREGDTMILAGTDGPITTQIKALLMPQPMKELRVKNAYIEHKEIMAAQGVKIAAKELEKAIAGINMQIAQKPDEVELFREIVARDFKSILRSIKLSDQGVFVQASTLGSLEALLEFLKTSKIPYAGIRIGPVVKRDVMKASIMLEHESTYATILAFDVKIERDAQDLADNLGVKIFQADIIYHLFDKFMAYRDELKKAKREEFKSIAVFPCKLKILPQFVFNSRDPIVMGVIVEAGVLKEGTPICVPTKEFVELGVVTSIEMNHKNIDAARKGQEVCIKIEPIPGDTPKMFGRHFEETDMLVSKISRQSIDACKNYFRDDLLKSDWTLMVELKKTFEIL
ncbi:unnamed protein product [Diamesa serratosioi]